MIPSNVDQLDFTKDSTSRLSCRKGDFLIWFSWANIFSNPKQSIRIQDIWEFKDGDFVTITNRVEDFPEWLRLHPTEVKGRLVRKLIDEFNKGFFPEQPIEGANIWRPKTGDRLIWYGSPDSYDSDNPIKKVIFFNECSFVFGENNKAQLYDLLVDFGALSKTSQTLKEIEMARMAKEYIVQTGVLTP